MEPRTIRIGAILYPPESTKCAFDSICPARGIAMDAALIACQQLPWPCEFSWSDTNWYGDFDNFGQQGTGMVGSIAEGRYDTSLPVFTATYRRSLAISFTQNYFTFDTVLVTRTSSLEEDLPGINWNVISAWQYSVWICFLIMLAIAATFFILNGTYHPQITSTSAMYGGPAQSQGTRLRDLPKKYLENILILLNIEERHHKTRYEHGAIALSWAFWSLGAIVLTTAYTGMLFTRTVADTKYVPFTDMETFADCLEKKECRYVASTTSSSFFDTITSPESSLGKRIKTAFENINPPLITDPSEDIPALIQRERKLYLVTNYPDSELKNLVIDYPPCSFRIVHTDIAETWAFPVRKNDTQLLRALEKVALPFREHGFDYDIQQNYRAIGETCVKTETDSTGITVSFDDVKVTLFFFVLGCGVSAAALGFEILIKRREGTPVIALGTMHTT